MNNKSTGTKIQGEGDYEAARRYDEGAASFAKSGSVDQAAKDAKPRSKAEQQEMEKAEREGRSHAKGEDPALKKGSSSRSA